MAVKENLNLKVIPKPESISWEEITDLLHKAYAVRAEKGMDYLATYQDAETTKKRVGDGTCLVALSGTNLIGTATLQIKDVLRDKKKWHNQNKFGLIVQLGVHPEYKGLGIGKILLKKVDEIALENGVEEVIGDTSGKAKELLSWWKGLGYEYIELLSHPHTNYYSIVLRKHLKGKKFNSNYIKFKFYISAVKCNLLYDRLGKIRRIWKK